MPPGTCGSSGTCGTCPRHFLSWETPRGSPDRQSALRQPYSAPDLGAVIPTGRGLFESTTSLPKAVQVWYDTTDNLQAFLARQVPIVTDKFDLTPFLAKPGDGPSTVDVCVADLVDTPEANETVEVATIDFSLEGLRDLDVAACDEVTRARADEASTHATRPMQGTSPICPSDSDEPAPTATEASFEAAPPLLQDDERALLVRPAEDDLWALPWLDTPYLGAGSPPGPGDSAARPEPVEGPLRPPRPVGDPFANDDF